MGDSRLVGSSRCGILGAQSGYRRKGGLRRRVDAGDDRALYRAWTLLYDPAGRTYAGICGGIDPACNEKDIDGQDGAFCAFPVVGNGGGGMAVRKYDNAGTESDTGHRHGNMGRMARGYMTVEASFIISWTIFIFVFLIYLSFYSYDKCVLFQDAYAVCFRGSIQKDEDNVVPYISAHIQEQFGKKYFGTGEVRGSVDRNGHVTDVTGECQVKVPIRSLVTMYDKGGWKIRTQARAQIINPTHIIRKSRSVRNVFAE